MKNKILFILILLFNIAALAYLVQPVPKLPDLPQSVKSQEPGDTVQISNVSAYYTNLSRQQVMDFYLNNYNGPFRIRLNHPPEKAKEIIRDTIQSYYFEELTLPYKESIYINGFEWENDVFTKPDKRIKNKLFYNGIEYKSKVTIRNFPVSLSKRLAVFFLTEVSLFILFFIYRRVLKTIND